MDRRKSLKAIALGTLSTGLLLDACKETDKKVVEKTPPADANIGGPDRTPEEVAHYKEVTSYTFFTAHEMATITILADIIIPKDEVSGSASDAKVPEFIEFIVKDFPEHKTPMRGGLKWLDIQCNQRFNKTFKDCSSTQQIEMVDEIAYPNKAKPGMKPGVAFFNRMRNLTASGFYTTQIGFNDIGYVGNKPNQWNGVPGEVLQQYKLAYSDKELRECISFDTQKT